MAHDDRAGFPMREEAVESYVEIWTPSVATVSARFMPILRRNTAWPGAADPDATSLAIYQRTRHERPTKTVSGGVASDGGATSQAQIAGQARERGRCGGGPVGEAYYLQRLWN